MTVILPRRHLTRPIQCQIQAALPCIALPALEPSLKADLKALVELVRGQRLPCSQVWHPNPNPSTLTDL